jgi:hypothetical protein
MRFMLVAGLALLASTTVPGRLTAQSGAHRPIAPNQELLIATAQLGLPARPPFGLERHAGALVTQRARGDKRQGEILMIVGAAGILTGLLVDEDLVTIAGAGVGGFGLYLYLRATH